LILETRHSIAEILSRQPMFRGLSEIELAQISTGCREFRIKKNEVLFHKGDQPEGMHVVVMGQMKLALPSSQGVEKIVHMCGPGATFGEAVVFLDKPYPVSAQAMTESLVLLVSKRVLLDAMDNNAMLSRKMLASLSSRLHELLGDMETCTLRTSMQRVVCFLIQAAPADETPVFDVALQSSKQNIASQMNLAPETFSRVLGHLSEKGLIKVKGRTITVLNRQLLRNFTA
jgi:CRP/FNR family transcriptional regulator, dissimilatory nitrate respiration regulator